MRFFIVFGFFVLAVVLSGALAWLLVGRKRAPEPETVAWGGSGNILDTPTSTSLRFYEGSGNYVELAAPDIPADRTYNGEGLLDSIRLAVNDGTLTLTGPDGTKYELTRLPTAADPIPDFSSQIVTAKIDERTQGHYYVLKDANGQQYKLVPVEGE